MSSSPSINSVTRAKERTEYQNKTFSLQHSSRKKRGSLSGKGIGLTIGGIVLAIILVLAMSIFQQGGVFICGVGLVALAMFFSGVFMLFQAIFGKTRSVTCPYCGEIHKLARSSRSYICDGCGHVLRFAGEGDDLCEVTCPHCALEWAASINMGQTNCFSCGAAVTIANGAAQFSTETQRCPSCDASNPAGSYFCWQCGTLITPPNPVKEPDSDMISESITVEPNADGMDFISIRANAPIGLIFRAVSRLNTIIAEANNFVDNPYVIMIRAERSSTVWKAWRRPSTRIQNI